MDEQHEQATQERVHEVRKGEPEGLERVLTAGAALGAALLGQMSEEVGGPMVAAINDGKAHLRFVLDCTQRVAWNCWVMSPGQPNRAIARRHQVAPADVLETDLFKAIGGLITEMVAELSAPERATLAGLMAGGKLFFRVRLDLGGSWRARLTAVTPGVKSELHIGTLSEASDTLH